MLDAFIIEELKRREQERRRDERPTLRIPLDEEAPPESDEDIDPEDEEDGSVIIIDYGS
jgi:hypothetical protein